MEGFEELLNSAAAAPRQSPAPWAGAIGPEIAQQRGVRRRIGARALLDSARANGRLDGRGVNSADGIDAGTPQRFASRVQLRDLATGASVSIDTATAYLPGPKPPAGWDGDYDGSSPFQED